MLRRWVALVGEAWTPLMSEKEINMFGNEIKKIGKGINDH